MAVSWLKGGEVWVRTGRDCHSRKIQVIGNALKSMAREDGSQHLKSRVSKETYRFNSGPGHHLDLAQSITLVWLRSVQSGRWMLCPATHSSYRRDSAEESDNVSTKQISDVGNITT